MQAVEATAVAEDIAEAASEEDRVPVDLEEGRAPEASVRTDREALVRTRIIITDHAASSGDPVGAGVGDRATAAAASADLLL